MTEKRYRDMRPQISDMRPYFKIRIRVSNNLLNRQFWVVGISHGEDPTLPPSCIDLISNSKPNLFIKTAVCLVLHCVKSVRIRSYPGTHFPAFGVNIQSESGKMRTRITTNTDTIRQCSLHSSCYDKIIFTKFNLFILYPPHCKRIM